MKHISAILCLLLCITGQGRAQVLPVPNVSMNAEKLERAYLVLYHNPLAVSSQLLYLQFFPKTKDAFVAMFDPDDKKELYKVNHDFIAVLQDIGTNFPDSVLRIGINIGKQMEWATGASEDLQHIILSIASKNIESFVREVYLLKRQEIGGLVGYLADVEQKPLCSLYYDLVKNLEEAGAYNISGRLVRAKGTSH